MLGQITPSCGKTHGRGPLGRNILRDFSCSLVVFWLFFLLWTGWFFFLFKKTHHGGWRSVGIFCHSTYETRGVRQAAISTDALCHTAFRIVNPPSSHQMPRCGRCADRASFLPLPKRKQRPPGKRKTGNKLRNSAASGCIQHWTKASRKQGSGHKHSSHLLL